MIAQPLPNLPRSLGIDEYQPADGDHLCSLWTDPSADRLVGRRFLLGVRPEEAALAILDPSRDADPSVAAVGAGLAQEGVHLFSTQQVHVEGGHFDAERMRRFWSHRSDRIRNGGLRHLRAVAEMAWAVQGLPGTDGAPEFESSLNPLFASLPVSVICQYGSTRIRPETLLAMVLSHPLVVIGETVFSNPFYVEHDRFAERLASLRCDPVEALMPFWGYFAGEQPALPALARFLCNSLPSLISAHRVLVDVTGLPPALALDVASDRVEPADAMRWQRLRLAARRSRPLGEGPWGAVRAAAADGIGVLTASLDGGRHTLTVTRDGGFSERDELRFVMLAWDAARAIKTLAGAATVPAAPNGAERARG